MSSPRRFKAYAKINLFLDITGKRADGYHTLSTIFQTVSLADELTLRPSETLRLTCSDPGLPTDERNLAYRAAHQLRMDLKERRGAHIHLDKIVPVGAGLGGGSSDAGTLLTALSAWWKRKPSNALLRRRALGLGADVPFFLKGGTCAAGGIGDALRPLPPLPKTWIVLVYPGFGVSTKEAYAKIRLPFTHAASMKKILSLLRRRDPAAWVGHLFNRFEEFVFPEHPKLIQLKRELLDAGALGALMSGSGSSVFGVAEHAAAGRRLLAAIQKKYPQSWLVHTI